MYAEIKKEDKILINRLDNNEKILLKSIVNNSSNKTIALQELYSDDGEFGGCFVNLTEGKEKEELKEMNLLGTLDDFTIQKGNVAVIQFITDVPDNDIDVYIRWTGKQALLDSSTISLYPERTGTFSYCILAEGYKPYLGDFTITVEEQPVDNKGTVKLKIYAGPDNDITEANEVVVICKDKITDTPVEVVRVIDSEGYYTFQVPDYTHPYTIKVSYPAYVTFNGSIEFDGKNVYETTVTLNAESTYDNATINFKLFNAEDNTPIDLEAIGWQPSSMTFVDETDGTLYSANSVSYNNIIFVDIPTGHSYSYNIENISGYASYTGTINTNPALDMMDVDLYLSPEGQHYDNAIVDITIRDNKDNLITDLDNASISLHDNNSETYYDVDNVYFSQGIVRFNNVSTNHSCQFIISISGYTQYTSEFVVSDTINYYSTTIWLVPSSLKLNISIFDENNMPITIDQNIHNIQLSHEGGEYDTPDIIDNNVITYNNIPNNTYYTFRLANVEGYKDFNNSFFINDETIEESLSFNLEPVGPVDFTLDLRDRDREPINVSEILGNEGLESLEELSNHLKVVNRDTDEQYYPIKMDDEFGNIIHYNIPGNTPITVSLDGLQHYRYDSMSYTIPEDSNSLEIHIIRNEETKYDYGTIRVRLGNESGEELNPLDVSESLPDKIKLYADYGDGYGDEYPMDTDSISMNEILFRNIPTDMGYVLHRISPITINGISYNFSEEDMYIRKRVLHEEDQVYITLTRVAPEPQIDIQVGHTYRITPKENIEEPAATSLNNFNNIFDSDSQYGIGVSDMSDGSEITINVNDNAEQYGYYFNENPQAGIPWDGIGWYENISIKEKVTPPSFTFTATSIDHSWSTDEINVLTHYINIEDITA